MIPDYLILGDVLAIHADQIATYGSTDEIRAPGQLDTALFRLQTGYYADIIAEATVRQRTGEPEWAGRNHQV